MLVETVDATLIIPTKNWLIGGCGATNVWCTEWGASNMFWRSKWCATLVWHIECHHGITCGKSNTLLELWSTECWALFMILVVVECQYGNLHLVVVRCHWSDGCMCECCTSFMIMGDLCLVVVRCHWSDGRLCECCTSFMITGNLHLVVARCQWSDWQSGHSPPLEDGNETSLSS